MNINGDQIELLDDFNLNDFVISAQFGDASDNKPTLQLLSQTASGSINLQYMGTKVIFLNNFRYYSCQFKFYLFLV